MHLTIIGQDALIPLREIRKRNNLHSRQLCDIERYIGHTKKVKTNETWLMSASLEPLFFMNDDAIRLRT